VISNVRPLSIGDAMALERLPRVHADRAGGAGQRSGEIRPAQPADLCVRRGHGGAPSLAEWRWPRAVSCRMTTPRVARPYAVLGSKVRDELFGSENPLGGRIRIGSEQLPGHGGDGIQRATAGF
jgi:putative ABC transport system permease protein